MNFPIVPSVLALVMLFGMFVLFLVISRTLNNMINELAKLDLLVKQVLQRKQRHLRIMEMIKKDSEPVFDEEEEEANSKKKKK
jgi:hypothetical protein